MKKLILIVFVLFFLFSGIAVAANTITPTGNFVTIEDIDSDWSWSDQFPNYPRVFLIGIQFNPGAADDQCVIKEGSDTGSDIMDVTAESAYDERYKPVGVESRPVLDYSAGTYSAGSKVIFTFKLY